MNGYGMGMQGWNSGWMNNGWIWVVGLLLIVVVVLLLRKRK